MIENVRQGKEHNDQNSKEMMRSPSSTKVALPGRGSPIDTVILVVWQEHVLTICSNNQWGLPRVLVNTEDGAENTVNRYLLTCCNVEVKEGYYASDSLNISKGKCSYKLYLVKEAVLGRFHKTSTADVRAWIDPSLIKKATGYEDNILRLLSEVSNTRICSATVEEP